MAAARSSACLLARPPQAALKNDKGLMGLLKGQAAFEK